MTFPAPKAFNEEGIQFVWDSTSISLAETCLRKYKFKMIDGWQPYERSVHLEFGGLYATALEHYFKHLADGMSVDEALCAIVHEALVSSWNFDVDAEGNRSGGAPMTFDHNTKTRENLIRTIVWYFEEFEGNLMTTYMLSNGRPAVEHSFKLPVDNGLIFSGHLDRLVNYSGGVYVMDQKTTGGAITQYFFDGFSPDIQMSMYTFAGKAIFDIPVKGVVIDAAQIMVGFTRFARGFAFRTPSQLDEWYDNSMYTIEVAQAATKANHFPMNRASCGNYGGCEFRKICSRSPDVREQFLKADFKLAPRWDPATER